MQPLLEGVLRMTHCFVMVQGPPPGFTTPLAHMNGRPSLATPSYSSSESLSAALDQQPQAWHPEAPSPQSRPHPWLSQPSEQPASSSPLAGYQANAFAMPSLSSGLDSLRSNSGAAGNGNGSTEQAAEHSLFSGSSHVLGFPQSQFRQQSRFQFAQELPSGNAVGAGAHPQQVPATPFASSLGVFQQGQQQDPLQQQQQRLSLFRHDAAHSQEAIHPFARQQAAFGYHGFSGQSSNGEAEHSAMMLFTCRLLRMFSSIWCSVLCIPLSINIPCFAALSMLLRQQSDPERCDLVLTNTIRLCCQPAWSNGVTLRSCAGPGQALLSQLQMPRSLSSSQQAQPDSRQPPPDGRGLNSSLSSMPFFDPVILSATSSSSLDRGGKFHLLSASPAGSLASACILPAETALYEVVTGESCISAVVAVHCMPLQPSLPSVDCLGHLYTPHDPCHQ